MSSLLLKGGRLIDPANGRDENVDLLLVDGKVASVGADAPGQAPEGTQEIDVAGKVVCPGLIDIHVHFREPGQTAKETIDTGAGAAATCCSATNATGARAAREPARGCALLPASH